MISKTLPLLAFFILYYKQWVLNLFGQINLSFILFIQVTSFLMTQTISSLGIDFIS